MITTSISVVVPVKDEAQTLEQLVTNIIASVQSLNEELLEILFIDDGSTDDSWSVMSKLAHDYAGLVLPVRLRRNFGKTTALDIAFNKARGDIVITLDADLQDDAAEIPKILDKLNGGYDVVSGWKVQRNDPLSKTLPSKIFNRFTSLLTGINLHDFNCRFKAYRKEVVKKLTVYGEQHRYIPVLAHALGYRVGEVRVNHLARKFGKSKYGMECYVRGALDGKSKVRLEFYAVSGYQFGQILLESGQQDSMTVHQLKLPDSVKNKPIGRACVYPLNKNISEHAFGYVLINSKE